MTSVAVAPGSLGAPPTMLTPKMYLQQGLSPTSGSPTSGKVGPRNPSARESLDVRFTESRDAMRERACLMRDGGVLRNGTQPRLKSWNLIRGH